MHEDQTGGAGHLRLSSAKTACVLSALIRGAVELPRSEVALLPMLRSLLWTDWILLIFLQFKRDWFNV